ncbi:MAG TPA: rhodanese-like domain-containing protein [Desulfarculaceae bacterium]|nr:rhodanese-like domain-containing protein [Desulfarculaceae bacterium]
MYLQNDKLIVVDVREKKSEYCNGHIPCAINLPINTSVFGQEFMILPKDDPILVVCRSGSRSAKASKILTEHGYKNVYSMKGGMFAWTGERIATCEEGNDCQRNYLYFPHIASVASDDDDWETEIAIINTSAETSLSGIIKSYNEVGKQVGELKEIDLKPNGRYETKIGETFSDPELISYLIFTASSDQAYGYLKFYDSSNASYRVAIPAPATVNHDDIIISHIAVSDGWWTGISLVNTTNESRTLTFTFNNDPTKVKTLTLAAGAHQAKDLAKFLDGWQLDEIESAVISNAQGIIGLEIFGNSNQLSGVLLRDTTAQTLSYPHITSDQNWWTGIVAFNAGTSAGTLTIKPYAEDGSPLAEMEPFEIGAKERFVRAVSQLDLPAETGWLAIESTVPISGFEPFGTSDNLQLAGYTCVGIDGMSGVFPKLDKSGWSGIALVNTSSGKISVTLNAYRNDGRLVAAKTLPLTGFQKIVDEPKIIFDNELDSAIYITYKATAPVAAFQLNGDGEMLDALPGR